MTEQEVNNNLTETVESSGEQLQQKSNELENTNTTKQRDTIKLSDEQHDKYVDINGVSYPKEIVNEAKLQGWLDYDKLKDIGQEDKYLPPDDFVERGKVAVPFLHKKIDKQEAELRALREENKKMTDLIQKQLNLANEDKKDRLLAKLESAKQDLDAEQIEKITRKLSKLEENSVNENKNDVNNNAKQDIDSFVNSYEYTYIKRWDERNPWIKDYDNPKSKYARETFDEIQRRMPYAPIEQKISILEENINMKFKNTNNNSNTYFSPARINNGVQSTKKTIENLKPEHRKFAEEGWEMCKNLKKYSGDREKYNNEFLKDCEDSDFL